MKNTAGNKEFKIMEVFSRPRFIFETLSPIEMRLLLVLILLPLITTAQEDAVVDKEIINIVDLFGEWKYEYIEAFDWSSYGLESDSLEIDYYLTFSQGTYTESMISIDSGFVRTGKWEWDAERKILQVEIYNQASKDEAYNQNMIGFKIDLEIIALNEDELEFKHRYGVSQTSEPNIEGFGLCKLKRVK